MNKPSIRLVLIDTKNAESNRTMRTFLTISILIYGCLQGLCSVPAGDEFRLPYLLGSCNTPLAGSSHERNRNITITVNKISGLILIPGETFS